MITITLVDQMRLVAFWLCFTRWVTIIFQLPHFDRVGIPSIVKILTSFFIAFAFFPTLEPAIMKDIQFVGSENYFWVLTIYQALVGLVIGYLVKAIMTLYTSAGSIISQQMGFGAVQYFDPNANQQVGPIEKLLSGVVVVLVVSSGALLPMFSGIFQSFSSITFANLGKLGTSPLYFKNLFISMFESAILLASPLLFTNIILTSIMGVIARIIPQMNILMVSFVVNIGVGLLVLTSISYEFFNVAYQKYVEYLGQWFMYMK